jgi:hypothetical protein
MGIYTRRGLNQETAHLVATQLMAHDALDAHARDELGISETTAARPVQAALVSALSFAVGAALPLAVVPLAPAGVLLEAIVIAALPRWRYWARWLPDWRGQCLERCHAVSFVEFDRHGQHGGHWLDLRRGGLAMHHVPPLRLFQIPRECMQIHAAPRLQYLTWDVVTDQAWQATRCLQQRR